MRLQRQMRNEDLFQLRNDLIMAGYQPLESVDDLSKRFRNTKLKARLAKHPSSTFVKEVDEIRNRANEEALEDLGETLGASEYDPELEDLFEYRLL